MQLIRTGKVKEVYTFAQNELLFRFTDNVSVFDKIIPSQIPRKGEVLCRTAVFWFRECERLGIRTHFKAIHDVDKMLVKKVEVIPDYDKLSTTRTNYLIPLEVICRHYVAGSLHDRLKRGEIRPEALGLQAGKVPEYGTKLPTPFIEFTTKLEKVDRELTEAEAMTISAITPAELAAIKSAVLAIDGVITRRAEKAGLIHVDGKKEFAFDERRDLMVVDTFGTLDEDRWWDAEAYRRTGETIELSKEFVRQHYRATGYHQQLMDARKAKRPEPPIPALPPEVVKQVSDLYVSMFERMAGESF